jgi:hypothetical protein
MVTNRGKANGRTCFVMRLTCEIIDAAPERLGG